MDRDARVRQARRDLARLQADERLLPAERELVTYTTLGQDAPHTLGQAHRLIDALGAMLTRITMEIPL